MTAKRVEAMMVELDTVVAESLGFDAGELAEIYQDLDTDPILQHLRPRLPGAEPRAQGFIFSLKSGSRYR